MTAAFLVDGVRTPFGKYGGALAQMRPDDLAAHVITSLIDRHPGIDPATIDDVVFGNTNGAGEENRNVARMALLLAGLPTSVPGTTVNRLCGSGLQACIDASRAIRVGEADIVIAGGVESMTRAPWVVQKPSRGFPSGSQTMASTTLGWRLVNPRMPEQWTVALGESTEILVEKYGVSREEQDEFAEASHRRATEAWAQGIHSDGITLVPNTDLTTDESIRPTTSLEGLAALKPAFREGGSVTAGNSSPLNDGAAAAFVTSEAVTQRIGVEPLARMVSSAVVGVDPDIFGIGPVDACNLALRRAGVGWDAIKVVEINEAFAGQTLACLRALPDLDPTIVNPHGGAIAIGHPLGASGTRIILDLARELRRRGGGFGVASMCIGVGQGIAVVIEV
ncbi:MAG: thiolase [Aeromicrobium sp.]|nr:thiolase [Ilumatobacteraceae bacterium]MCW2801338.1 thiolase [Aeromicrobium sp.]